MPAELFARSIKAGTPDPSEARRKRDVCLVRQLSNGKQYGQPISLRRTGSLAQDPGEGSEPAVGIPGILIVPHRLIRTTPSRVTTPSTTLPLLVFSTLITVPTVPSCRAVPTVRT